VSLNAGPKPILSNVDWQVGPGDRVALLGANGAGKTTLLRMLAGRLDPTAGRFVTGSTVRPAFLSQELTDREPALGPDQPVTIDLPGHLRVLEAVEEVARRVMLGDRELSAAQLAEVFGFTDRWLWTPVRDLSGGQRRRLQMLRLLATEPNVLLLDEPTNDLDTDTLAGLEDLLDSWPGTVIVASHDRYLVERVTDTAYALFGDGRLTHLPGGVDEYLARVTAPTPGAAASVAPAPGVAAPGVAASGVAASGVAAPSVAAAGVAAAGVIRAGRKELTRLERQVERLTEREAGLHERLAQHATDYEKLADLDAELRAVQAERARTEEEWLALAERLGDG
jgi:ABC-type multidrug transport system ATPase subunit